MLGLVPKTDTQPVGGVHAPAHHGNGSGGYAGLKRDRDSVESDGGAKRQATLVVGGPQGKGPHPHGGDVHPALKELRRGREMDPNMVYTATMLVPNEAMGLLIGKSGHTRQEISNDSGARIRVQVSERERGTPGMRRGGHRPK
jgi:hypothetical protein